MTNIRTRALCFLAALVLTSAGCSFEQFPTGPSATAFHQEVGVVPFSGTASVSGITPVGVTPIQDGTMVAVIVEFGTIRPNFISLCRLDGDGNVSACQSQTATGAAQTFRIMGAGAVVGYLTLDDPHLPTSTTLPESSITNLMYRIVIFCPTCINHGLEAP